MPVESPVETVNQLEEAQRLSKIPHVTIPRPSQLKRERLIFAASIAIPFVGFLGAIALAWYSGMTAIDWILFVSMFFLTVLGIETGYHRLFSHHAFETVAPIRAFLAIAGCMASQGPVIYWVSNHRRHHIYSDQLNDPHSPYFKGEKSVGFWQGFWHAHIGWIFDAERTCPGRYGRDILKDPLIMTIDKYYFVWLFLGLLIPTILAGVLTWSWEGLLHGFLWGGMARMFLVQQGTYGINSFCHVFGDRPFDTREKSTNNICLTIPTLGGSLHNTHHAFPNTAINGFQWWELDPSAWFVRGLEKLNLAWNIKVPTAELIAAKKVK